MSCLGGKRRPNRARAASHDVSISPGLPSSIAFLLCCTALLLSFSRWVWAAAGPPTNDEYGVLVFINEVRAAPGGAGEKVVPPLAWNDELAAAARSHSDDMIDHGCYQHDSCDGTPWYKRIEKFYPSGGVIGENIGPGFTGPTVLNMWLASPDHRANLLSAAYTEVGVGSRLYPVSQWVDAGVTTADFGSRAPSAPTGLPAGTVLPRTGGSESRQILVNFYDASGAAPRAVYAQVGTSCQRLALVFGKAGHGTYGLTAPVVGNGCVPLVFQAQSAGGAAFRFPKSGGILVGVGTSSCAERTTAPPNVDCAGGVPPSPTPTPAPTPAGDVSLSDLSLSLRPGTNDPARGQVRAHARFAAGPSFDPSQLPVSISITYGAGQTWSATLPMACGTQPCLRGNPSGSSYRSAYGAKAPSLRFSRAGDGSWRVDFTDGFATLGAISSGAMTFSLDAGGVHAVGSAMGVVNSRSLTSR
jgi:cysteine-rich secretory family protein